ncbi:hypothetical protein [Kribbella sp.]|uniref:hypothetical protein n=1 Tax=Kribbella sp. TaxID=1871183 RepID=UPI002D24496C|nr:hypothetical protein [Kribbella sp.]HZX07195.1 hypothetical protein [Kribbella sp.]
MTDTKIEELTYDQAVAKYMEAFDRGDDYPAPLPNKSMSYRNDRNGVSTGWRLSNVRGYLAFVPDRGGVLR